MSFALDNNFWRSLCADHYGFVFYNRVIQAMPEAVNTLVWRRRAKTDMCHVSMSSLMLFSAVFAYVYVQGNFRQPGRHTARLSPCRPSIRRLGRCDVTGSHLRSRAHGAAIEDSRGRSARQLARSLDPDGKKNKAACLRDSPGDWSPLAVPDTVAPAAPNTAHRPAGRGRESLRPASPGNALHTGRETDRTGRFPREEPESNISFNARFVTPKRGAQRGQRVDRQLKLLSTNAGWCTAPCSRHGDRGEGK